MNEKSPFESVVAVWHDLAGAVDEVDGPAGEAGVVRVERAAVVESSNTSPLIVTGTNSPKFTVSAWPLSSVTVTLAADEATYPDCETTWTV